MQAEPTQRVSVDVINRAKHMERHKECDAVLHCFALGHHQKIGALSEEAARRLHKGDQVRYRLALELFRVGVEVLKHQQALLDFTDQLHVQ